MAPLATVIRKNGVTLGESVRAALSERLMAGGFAPGDKVSLRSLAEALGVSVTPVREAVTRLVADNALEVAPNRAIRIPTLTIGQFREITILRIEIEGMAAARAAAARHDDDIAAMMKHEAQFRAEGKKTTPDVIRAAAANQRLHFAIYRATKSPKLVDIIAGLWLNVGPILNLDMQGRLKSGQAILLHAAAVAAIRKGDGEAARAAIAEDIRITSSSIIDRHLLPR